MTTFERNSTRCWGMFAVLMLSAMSVGLSQLKITPVMAELAASLGVTVTDAAWLTSVFTLAGILLSVPGAGLIGRFGPKSMLVFMLSAIICGNVLGAFATSFGLMLVSRIIEGVAAVFTIPVGVELINRWFSGASIGIATGIFMTSTPIATFLVTGLGLQVTELLGDVKSLWWIIAALDTACMLLVLAFVKVPRLDDGANAGEAADIVASFKATCSSRPLILLCGAMLCLTFALYSLITCYPQVFAFYGLSAELSNLLTSLNGLIGIPMSVISGIIIGRTGKPYAVAIVGAAGALAVCATLPYLTDATYALNVVGSAVFPGGIVISPMFVLAPLLVNRASLGPMATSLMNTFFYLGQLVSTPVTTALSDGNTTWLAPSLALSVACIGLLALLIASQRALASTPLMQKQA